VGGGGGGDSAADLEMEVISEMPGSMGVSMGGNEGVGYGGNIIFSLHEENLVREGSGGQQISSYPTSSLMKNDSLGEKK
jgi:hypothetical protein